MKTKRSFVSVSLVPLLSCLSAAAHLSAAPAAQTGFEHDDQRWVLYVPAESNSAGCDFRILSVAEVRTHRGTACASLSAVTPARLGVQPKANPILVVPGEKYLFKAWVKPGRDWSAAPDSPGVVLECISRDVFQKDIRGGKVFIGLKGVSSDPSKLSGSILSPDWTKVSGIVEIPAGAYEMTPFVFVWKGSGRVLIDDISIEKVTAETPLTLVLD